jgi:uncharacterized coiled-coil DUF342 family protein
LNIQQTIADFKTCPLDPEEEKRLQEEIKKWKDYGADVDRLKEEMTNVKLKIREAEKTQEEIKRRLDEGMLFDAFCSYIMLKIIKLHQNMLSDNA